MAIILVHPRAFWTLKISVFGSGFAENDSLRKSVSYKEQRSFRAY
jgi:hypothetical protein